MEYLIRHLGVFNLYPTRIYVVFDNQHVCVSRIEEALWIAGPAMYYLPWIALQAPTSQDPFYLLAIGALYFQLPIHAVCPPQLPPAIHQEGAEPNTKYITIHGQIFNIVFPHHIFVVTSSKGKRPTHISAPNMRMARSILKWKRDEELEHKRYHIPWKVLQHWIECMSPLPWPVDYTSFQWQCQQYIFYHQHEMQDLPYVMVTPHERYGFQQMIVYMGHSAEEVHLKHWEKATASELLVCWCAYLGPGHDPALPFIGTSDTYEEQTVHSGVAAIVN